MKVEVETAPAEEGKKKKKKKQKEGETSLEALQLEALIAQAEEAVSLIC